MSNVHSRSLAFNARPQRYRYCNSKTSIRHLKTPVPGFSVILFRAVSFVQLVLFFTLSVKVFRSCLLFVTRIGVSKCVQHWGVVRKLRRACHGSFLTKINTCPFRQCKRRLFCVTFSRHFTKMFCFDFLWLSKGPGYAHSRFCARFCALYSLLFDSIQLHCRNCQALSVE